MKEKAGSRPLPAANLSIAQPVPKWGTIWESWVLALLFLLLEKIPANTRQAP